MNLHYKCSIICCIYMPLAYACVDNFSLGGLQAQHRSYGAHTSCYTTVGSSLNQALLSRSHRREVQACHSNRVGVAGGYAYGLTDSMPKRATSTTVDVASLQGSKDWFGCLFKLIYISVRHWLQTNKIIEKAQSVQWVWSPAVCCTVASVTAIYMPSGKCGYRGSRAMLESCA